jgi:hypothetical protein
MAPDSRQPGSPALIINSRDDYRTTPAAHAAPREEISGPELLIVDAADAIYSLALTMRPLILWIGRALLE